MSGESGAVESGAQVRIRNVDATQRTGANVVTTVPSNENGSFQASISAELGDLLELVAIDEALNESPPTTLTAGPTLDSIRLRNLEPEQTGVVGQTLPELLRARVSGPSGQVIPTITVLFEVVSGGGSVSRSRVATDLQGNATTALTLGAVEGANEVSASLELLPTNSIILTARAVGPPRVDRVTPDEARPGETVTIEGANFSPIEQHNVVRFGAELATVTGATETTLTVVVPPFAVSGAVSVTLTGVSSNGLDYTVLPAQVNGVPLGNVRLETLIGGTGQVTLPFEDADQEFTLVIQSLRPSDQSFSSTVAGNEVLIGSREIAGATDRRAPIEGESMIRTMERHLVRNLPVPRLRAEARRLATAQEIGSKRNFFVVNRIGAINLTERSNFDEITATLRFKGDNTLLYVDDRTPAIHLTEEVIQEIGDRFDDEIYPTDRAAFGPESDIDGNGQVIILLSPTVNSLTTPEIAEQGARVVGFFFGIDLLPNPVANPFANEAEVFYAVVPDPNMAFGSATVTVAETPELLSSTFAHEFEHMISFHQHVMLRNAQPEALWLDEGLAHMAETINDIDLQNRLRSAFFLAEPSSTTLVGGGDALNERGASWLFVQYMVDRFGENVLARLVQTSLRDIPNVSSATNRAFQTLFHEWAATLLLDETAAGAEADPMFDMPSTRLRNDYLLALQILDELAGSAYLDIQEIALPNTSITFDQLGTSPMYLRVSSRGRANVPVRIEGSPVSELQVGIVRTK